jgi:hypothetical protein
MSLAPSTGTVSDDLYDALEPLTTLDEDNGYALAYTCAAIGVMFQDVDDLIRDQGDRPGWANLLDIDTAPAFVLPYLAAIGGVKPTAGASDDVRRAEIKVVDGQRRGRPAAIIQAVQATLTGDQSVRFLEKAGGDPYALTVITRTAETPHPAGTLAAILRTVPAGLYPVVHTISDAPIIDEGTRTIDTSTGTIDAATVADVT